MRRFAFIDVELPKLGAFLGLCDKWIQACPLKDATEANVLTLKEKLGTLLNEETHLMRLRALGPAIVKDMICYVGDRYKHNVGNPLLDLLGEAFLLYAVPQLDGLDHKDIQGICIELKLLFAESAAWQNIMARIQSLYPHVPLKE